MTVAENKVEQLYKVEQLCAHGTTACIVINIPVSILIINVLILIITVLKSDWKTSHWLSERLASLGIMGGQLRDSLKPSVHHSTLSY